MALPTSPSIVVLENDVSIYTPNINSSVVGVVGFANKGPVDKATLITSQQNLINTFGKPDSNIPGQGLEGALEILEATNQLYFVRAANSANLAASASVTLGTCPAVVLSSLEGFGTWDPTTASTIYYSATNNAGVQQVTGAVTLPASSTSFPTAHSVLFNSFDPNLLNDQPVFAAVSGSTLMLASKWAGSGATLRVSGGAEWEFVAISGNGDADITDRGSDNVVNGYTVSDVTLGAFSVDPGAGYNLSGLRDGSTQGVSVEVNAKSTRDELVVNSDGAQVESFRGSFISSGSDFFEYLLQDDDLNNTSDYIYVNAVSSDAEDYTGFPDILSDKVSVALDVNGLVDVQPRFVKPVEGTYGFAGGDSGYTVSTVEGVTDQVDSSTETALIGTAAGKTGIYALDDDSLNISIGIVPGITDDNVQNALATLAESSKNFLALIAPPYGVGEVQDAVDWINGKGIRTAAVNSSYVAAYWPWVQVFNSFAGAEEWYDPAIYAARTCVFTDAISEPWFAPAGFNRGRLTKPSDTEKALNQGDRDVLYSNSVNPIYKDPTAGITVYGQKTAQRTATALDRVNVRRLMIYIRKTLLQLGRPFQFQPNDEFTWELVEDVINPFLDDLTSRRAIVSGAVNCNSTTNTPLRVDRNELWCSITIKPTKAAETIVFEVNLTSQSATING